MSVLVAHLAATWAMIGVIWFVQIVHYPMFNRVGESSFARYERIHQQRTSWIVLPLMVLELITAIWLAVAPPEILERPWVTTNLGLLVLIWLSTFLIQVPLHRRLERGFDEKAHARLVVTNWIRTALWTGRGVLLATLIVVAGA